MGCLWICGFGHFASGRIPLHIDAVHGGLDIASARRNGVSAPPAACPSPVIEKFDIRFDDSARAHRSGACGTGAVRNPSRCPMDQETSCAVAIRHETENDNHPGFGAGRRTGRAWVPRQGAIGNKHGYVSAVGSQPSSYTVELRNAAPATSGKANSSKWLQASVMRLTSMSCPLFSLTISISASRQISCARSSCRWCLGLGDLPADATRSP